LREIIFALSAAIGLPRQKLYKTSNEVTKVIYHTGAAYQCVVDWLYCHCEIANPERKRIFEEIYQTTHRFRDSG